MATPTPIDASRIATLENDLQFRATIDRFGYLDAKCRAAKPDFAERDQLRTVIQERYAQAAADKPQRATGNLYYVDLSPRENQRSITDKAKAYAALRKGLGVAALVQALSYTLKLIDANVPEENQKPFIRTERTGPREVTAVLIVPPAA